MSLSVTLWVDSCSDYILNIYVLCTANLFYMFMCVVMETDASLLGVELEQKQQEELYQQLLLQVTALTQLSSLIT